MNTIIKLNKSSLSEYGRKPLFTEDAKELTIIEYADALKPCSNVIPFLISVAEIHAPQISEEFVIVIREKLDLTARGPNDVLINDLDKPVTETNYIDSKPYRPQSLPPGFQELLKL